MCIFALFGCIDGVCVKSITYIFYLYINNKYWEKSKHFSSVKCTMEKKLERKVKPKVLRWLYRWLYSGREDVWMGLCLDGIVVGLSRRVLMLNSIRKTFWHGLINNLNLNINININLNINLNLNLSLNLNFNLTDWS